LSDFGERGALPSDSEWLDWLAAELVDSGWRTKHIHRLIVGSNRYRQGFAAHLYKAKINLTRTVHWRWPSRRLDAKSIRDSMLAVSGDLDTKAARSSDKEETKSSVGLSLSVSAARSERHCGVGAFYGNGRARG
jgi:hypothetical protein